MRKLLSVFIRADVNVFDLRCQHLAYFLFTDLLCNNYQHEIVSVSVEVRKLWCHHKGKKFKTSVKVGRRINSKLLFPLALELSSETEPPFGNTETDKLIWILSSSPLSWFLVTQISTASSLALHSSLCRLGQWSGFKMILLTSHTSESYFSSAELWDDSSGIKQFPTKQLMIRYDSMGPHTHPHLSWEVGNWIWDTAGLWSNFRTKLRAKSPLSNLVRRLFCLYTGYPISPQYWEMGTCYCESDKGSS